MFPVDDPSVTAELTRQGPAADHPRPAMVAQGRNEQEAQESSEIDTDDEIAAVRQVYYYFTKINNFHYSSLKSIYTQKQITTFG